MQPPLTNDLRLPRTLEEHPQRDAVWHLLTTAQHPLWEEGDILVPHPTVASVDRLAQALHEARRDRALHQGLETATRLLANEQRGLEAGAAKASGPHRLSRLLLIGPGGSRRFQRDCEALLRRHRGRLAAMVLGESFTACLERMAGIGLQTRLLIVSDQDAVARVLLAIVSS